MTTPWERRMYHWSKVTESSQVDGALDALELVKDHCQMYLELLRLRRALAEKDTHGNHP